MSDDMVSVPRAELEAIFIQAQRGSALEAWIATTALLGHTRPGHSLEYIHTEEWSAMAFVRDFVAWTSGRTSLAPGCEQRLREWGMEEAGNRMNLAAESLGLGAERAS